MIMAMAIVSFVSLDAPTSTERNMRTSQQGIDLIKKFESFSPKPYLCPACVPTIGYGTTVYPDGKKVTLKDKTISKEQAEALLFNDIRTFEVAVLSSVRVQLKQHEFDALVSFVYNVGVNAFKSSNLLNRLNSERRNEAADQFKQWVHAGGKALPGLIKRRDEERSLFLGEK